MGRILLVEDDARIAGFLKRGLEAEGHLVDHAENGESALIMLQAAEYPLVILDRMLGDIDGLEVCRQMRRDKRSSCVLMLTAKDSVKDKIEGLKDGADDYLAKPFAFDELIARVEALLRRAAKPATDPLLQVGDLILDSGSKKVRRGDRDIMLTAKEFALLTYLMENAGTVMSRTRLLNNVWSLNFDPETKIVDVYIRYLRRKIDNGGEDSLIKTLRGFGYTISAEPSPTCEDKTDS